MGMRRVTSEERQILLDHPELVMFYVKPGKEKVRLISLPFLIAVVTLSIIPSMAVSFLLYDKHPELAVIIPVVLSIVLIFGWIPIVIIRENRSVRIAEETHNIKLLRASLPKELLCNVVTIKAVVYEKMEGVWIWDGKEEWFAYCGYKNLFRLLPNTELAVVTDKKKFWAYIRHDAVTESFYRLEDEI